MCILLNFGAFVYRIKRKVCRRERGRRKEGEKWNERGTDERKVNVPLEPSGRSPTQVQWLLFSLAEQR